MVFSSIVFMFYYLPVVLAVYYLVPKKLRNWCLFLANLVFYGWGEPVYILLMLFSILINYVNGILIGRYLERDRRKAAKTVLTVNIVLNLSLLVLFKYADLLIETANALFGSRIAPLGLTLPIGISFYTFQTMSYPIDVYRGDTDVQKNFVDFGTFVALFPQLIAGPIVRYKDVASQLRDRDPGVDQFASGVRRFVLGLGKKVLIANNIGALWDICSAEPRLTVLGAWLGAVAFSLQLYFDFSGYSDMAIGLGRMLGFEFLENFDYPYISRSVTEFWRRWHISLGTWFRDYLYIPLGGNRKGLPRQMLNILIVWALTGLWHGANWTFLVWGLYYALFLLLEKAFLLKFVEHKPVFGHIYTVLVAVFGWMIFQLDSLARVGEYWGAMLGFRSAGWAGAHDLFLLKAYLPVLLIGAAAATPLLKKLYARIPKGLRRWTTPAVAALLLAASTAYLVDATYNPFLYFRF